MHVIGHDEVVPDKPGGRFRPPDVCQGVLHSCIGHPGLGVLGVDGDEENIRLTQVNMRAWRRDLAADLTVDAFTFGHEQSVVCKSSEERKTS